MHSLAIKILLFLLAFELFALERYELDANKSLFYAALDSAHAQVGVREATGRNDGKEVEAYLRSASLRKGNPYCAAGIYWCFYSAALNLGLAEQAIPIMRTGSTSAMWNDAKGKGRRTSARPYVGDLIFWRIPNDWRGHVEWVYKVANSGWVHTIGFNTSSGQGSQRDGEGVFYRKRNYQHFLSRMVTRGFIGFCLIERRSR